MSTSTFGTWNVWWWKVWMWSQIKRTPWCSACCGRRRGYALCTTKWWWFLTYFLNFHPIFGEMIQVDLRIFFQIGWFNHKLDMLMLDKWLLKIWELLLMLLVEDIEMRSSLDNRCYWELVRALRCISWLAKRCQLENEQLINNHSSLVN